MNRSIFLLVAVLLGAMGRAGSAQPIVYSWTGTIQPFNAEVDPWGLGDIATPFFISVAVKEDSLDGRGDIGDDLDLTLAAFSGFDLIDPEFNIDGEPATVGEGNRIFFFDHDFSDTVDLKFRNVFFRGSSEVILTIVRVPGSTFTFDENFESPPVFSPVLSTGGVGPFSESPYWAIVEPGVTVTGAPVPEPSGLVLAFLALLGAASIPLRNHSR